MLRTADAVRMGVLGYVARASGVDIDARRDHPAVDLGAVLPGRGFAPVVEQGGDVRARSLVRAREAAASAELVVALVERLAGHTGGGAPSPTEPAGTAGEVRRGLGVTEAWRGLLCHRVTLDPAGRLHRAKVVDPSFMTWPGLPVALADTIVPDFPLANKSFNPSYAGNDL